MDAVWIIFLFALGSCIGSFLNVVIYRLPRGQSIIFPASHCPACGRAIKWYDNVPLLSWVLLGGRCRFCKGKISPRYLAIEFLTGALLAGVYVCYFVLRLRDGVGSFTSAWPMFVAHAALLCGLLACSAVDIELFIVPLPVMWFCAALGIAAAAFRPHPFLAQASPAVAVASAGAVVGLLLAKGIMWLGWIQPSFLDAEDKPLPDGGDGDAGVAITAADGVSPRKEVLRELLFLTPAIVLGVGGYVLAARIAAVKIPLEGILGSEGGPAAEHVRSAMGAVFGLLIGMAWVWGVRILGTLGFGKEAMGMGDVHILAGVGAVAGAKVATLTFFVAPLFGLLWALYLLLVRGKRELPYGPWLALGALAVMLFYDALVIFLDRFVALVSAAPAV